MEKGCNNVNGKPKGNAGGAGNPVAKGTTSGSSSAEEESAMYTSLFFDVEDYTTPACYGMDEIPKWMSEIMTQEKVIGNHMLIGGKARSVRKPGTMKVRHLTPRYPSVAMECDTRMRMSYLNWPIFDRYMVTDNLCRYARLQTWTGKAAIADERASIG
jgi:hypothetical protein